MAELPPRGARVALGAATRDVATLRAFREGLYVPASFLDERD